MGTLTYFNFLYTVRLLSSLPIRLPHRPWTLELHANVHAELPLPLKMRVSRQTKRYAVFLLTDYILKLAHYSVKQKCGTDISAYFQYTVSTRPFKIRKKLFRNSVSRHIFRAGCRSGGKLSVLVAPEAKVSRSLSQRCVKPVSYTHLTLPTTPYV